MTEPYNHHEAQQQNVRQQKKRQKEADRKELEKYRRDTASREAANFAHANALRDAAALLEDSVVVAEYAIRKMRDVADYLGGNAS